MTKRHLEPVARGRLRLRLLEQTDLPKTLSWRNQDRVRKWFINSDVLTFEQHRRWFEQYVSRDDDFVFIVEETTELQKPVGQLAIYNIDATMRRAEFGRLIIGEPDALHKGLAIEATVVALQHYGFGVLQLNEIDAFIKLDNAMSRDALRACGFLQISEQDGFKRLLVRPEHLKVARPL